MGMGLLFSEAFMPYIKECYDQTNKVLQEYGSTAVVKSALKALANLTIAVSDYHNKLKDPDSLAGQFMGL